MGVDMGQSEAASYKNMEHAVFTRFIQHINICFVLSKLTFIYYSTNGKIQQFRYKMIWSSAMPNPFQALPFQVQFVRFPGNILHIPEAVQRILVITF